MRALELIVALRTSGVDDSTILNAVIAAQEERRAKERARVAKYRNNKEDRTRNTRTNVHLPFPETKVPTPLKTQPLSLPKETPSIEGGKKTPKIRRRIVDGWAPSEKDLEYARKLGLLEPEICTETEKFRDHHLKTGSLFLDWNAAWRTWCQRVNEFAVKPRTNGLGHYPKPTHPRDSFR